MLSINPADLFSIDPEIEHLQSDFNSLRSTYDEPLKGIISYIKKAWYVYHSKIFFSEEFASSLGGGYSYKNTNQNKMGYLHPPSSLRTQDQEPTFNFDLEEEDRIIMDEMYREAKEFQSLIEQGYHEKTVSYFEFLEACFKKEEAVVISNIEENLKFHLHHNEVSGFLADLIYDCMELNDEVDKIADRYFPEIIKAALCSIVLSIWNKYNDVIDEILGLEDYINLNHPSKLLLSKDNQGLGYKGKARQWAEIFKFQYDEMNWIDQSRTTREDFFRLMSAGSLDDIKGIRIRLIGRAKVAYNVISALRSTGICGNLKLKDLEQFEIFSTVDGKKILSASSISKERSKHCETAIVIESAIKKIIEVSS